MNANSGHFASRLRKRQAAELGMWVFLATEMMLFGPLLLGYAEGRWHSPEGFAAAARHTDLLLGTMNTAILLTSSLCMALAVRAAQLHHHRETLRYLLGTAVLGLAFLSLKGFEYLGEWREHLVPWLDFEFPGPQRAAASWFYILYFAMTGLHALHLSIGVIAVCTLATRMRLGQSMALHVETVGLYWHFVDGVWILLYPLLYLVGRHG